MSSERSGDEPQTGEEGARQPLRKPETGPPRRVLLVDDESSVLKVTGAVLRALGHTATPAGSGAEALRLVRERMDEPFELLITDLRMPEMNGKELATEFQKILPDAKVIFMSGLSPTAAVDRVGLDPIKDCFLPKPISVAVLRETIIELFR
jgi:CheY-like chemotaxis protein